MRMVKMGTTRGHKLGLGGKSSAFGNRGVEKRLTALKSLVSLSGCRLLDVGCADGTYTVPLAEGFDQVDAVDIESERLGDFSDKLRKDARLAAKITVQMMSAEGLSFPDDTFDAVTTIEVLEHVGDLDAALAEIHRVLRPSGTFLITSPNRWFPLETHGFIVGQRRLRPAQGPFLPWIKPLHRRWADARTFTVGSLTKQIESIGFERIGYSYIMPPFDRSRTGQTLGPLLDRVERSPASFFGMALVMVFRKM